MSTSTIEVQRVETLEETVIAVVPGAEGTQVLVADWVSAEQEAQLLAVAERAAQ